MVESGKNVILALDPSVKADNVPLLRTWSKKIWGICSKFLRNRQVLFCKWFKRYSATCAKAMGGERVFNLKMPIFFPLASHMSRQLTYKGEKYYGKVEIEPLLITSPKPHSWGELNHEEIIQQNYLYNSAEDVAAPVTLSALVSIENSGSLLLIGNSRFVENNYSQFMNNFDFLLKAIEHLSYKKSDLKLSMPMVEAAPMFINGIQIKLVFYLTIFVFPLIGLLIAFFTYRIRLK